MLATFLLNKPENRGCNFLQHPEAVGFLTVSSQIEADQLPDG
ncbi:hypothetical protein HMPREF0494_1285 [Limosilactobacillus antri DSM 16041]|uniref:Uncharacterized protein n=1 Tax=Limosilactobacillus antri DSM 16041 TaxID=525309 RepID=C8P7J1_9LACO|nr:hypothetical protein HMPREF0494_1285 [Limosilactobacillus antri DSM 16041]